jgi:hypothetical protein
MDAFNINQTLKRKWQLALRRYLLEGNKSFAYAKYFGLSSQNFRKWVEIQFTKGLNWDNYTEKWQLDHIVPIIYFDFNKEEDLQLAWSFLNIRPNTIDKNPGLSGNGGILGAKWYFNSLFEKTGFDQCRKMVEKIKSIEKDQQIEILPQVLQINEWKEQLITCAEFDNYDFEKINEGISIQKIVEEKEILKKRGL